MLPEFCPHVFSREISTIFVPSQYYFLFTVKTKDFQATQLRCLTAATAAVTLAFLFVERCCAMYWEGFTLVVCYVLKSGCSDESILIKLC